MPEKNIGAALDRIMENQNRIITEMLTVRSRLHAMANFLQASEQRVLDLRDVVRDYERVTEQMHKENRHTLDIIKRMIEQMCGRTSGQQDIIFDEREVADTPTPEKEDGKRDESDSPA